MAQSARVPVSFLRYILTFLGGMRPNLPSRAMVAPGMCRFIFRNPLPVTRAPRAPLTACRTRHSTRELCLNLDLWLARCRAAGLVDSDPRGRVEWRLSLICDSSRASRRPKRRPLEDSTSRDRVQRQGYRVFDFQRSMS